MLELRGWWVEEMRVTPSPLTERMTLFWHNHFVSSAQKVQLSDRSGLHPALAPLLPLWEKRRLALLQGVGYPAPNLPHFRSIEIWDTASRSNVVLPDGWLTRTFADDPVPVSFAADGVIIGSSDLGPLAGGRTRGGLYGAAPDLAALGGDGNPAYALDFRNVYARRSRRSGASLRATPSAGVSRRCRS